jgi:hypothetical protein
VLRCRNIELAHRKLRENIVRVWLLPISLGFLVTPAAAESLQLIGYSGYLGEWELTATVVAGASGKSSEYSGPLTMKHVGLCTQDGPEEKTGEIHLRMSAASSRLTATLRVAGVECAFRGELSDAYAGALNCPEREAVPLRLWVK